VTGWRHGPGLIPEAPEGLTSSSRALWIEWFGSWYAAHWDPSALSILEVAIKLHDTIVRGERGLAAELRLIEDSMGISPRGQQYLGWRKPKPEPVRATDEDDDPYAYLRVSDDPDLKPESRYAHLLVVDEPDGEAGEKSTAPRDHAPPSCMTPPVSAEKSLNRRSKS
jgi:hypothetical protein